MNRDVHSVADLDVEVVGPLFVLLSNEGICNERFVSLVIVNVIVSRNFENNSGNGNGNRIGRRRDRVGDLG